MDFGLFAVAAFLSIRKKGRTSRVQPPAFGRMAGRATAPATPEQTAPLPAASTSVTSDPRPMDTEVFSCEPARNEGGRPRLYGTEAERLEAVRQQKKEVMRRQREREREHAAASGADELDPSAEGDGEAVRKRGRGRPRVSDEQSAAADRQRQQAHRERKRAEQLADPLFTPPPRRPRTADQNEREINAQRRRRDALRGIGQGDATHQRGTANRGVSPNSTSSGSRSSSRRSAPSTTTTRCPTTCSCPCSRVVTE